MPDVVHIVAAFVLITTCSLAAVIDIHRQVIPNVLNLFVFFSGIIVGLLGGGAPWFDALMGSFIAAMIFGSISLGYERLRGEVGLGLGDVKFLIAIAAWVGWQGLPPLILGASTAALIFLLAKSLVLRSKSGTSRVTFGPFLAVAGMSIWLAQQAFAVPWIIG